MICNNQCVNACTWWWCVCVCVPMCWEFWLLLLSLFKFVFALSSRLSLLHFLCSNYSYLTFLFLFSFSSNPDCEDVCQCGVFARRMHPTFNRSNLCVFFGVRWSLLTLVTCDCVSKQLQSIAR